jgi:hypothetical protein
MDQCTENYECLVIDNNVKSNQLQEQIFWYRAENHKDFKLGSKEFWELSKNLGSDEEDDVYNPGDYKSKKGPKINVKKTKW